MAVVIIYHKMYFLKCNQPESLDNYVTGGRDHMHTHRKPITQTSNRPQLARTRLLTLFKDRVVAV